MAVTAKFKVNRVTWMGCSFIPDEEDPTKFVQVGTPYGAEVELTPDYGQGRNSEWSSATPSGVIRMTITNIAAVEQFIAGKAYTVTFAEEVDNAG